MAESVDGKWRQGTDGAGTQLQPAADTATGAAAGEPAGTEARGGPSLEGTEQQRDPPQSGSAETRAAAARDQEKREAHSVRRREDQATRPPTQQRSSSAARAASAQPGRCGETPQRESLDFEARESADSKRRSDTRRIPGLVLLLALLAAGITWTAAARFSRPVIRTSGGEAAAEGRVNDAHWPELRIDLNAADAAELTLLPGIGPGLAERIVADRTANGRFQRVEDLMRVKRIGPAIVDRLRLYATVE